jgi:hypothetical protein
VGDVVAGWKVSAIQHHPEFVRYWFRGNSGEQTGIEIAPSPGLGIAWSTSQYRLMPAPGEHPPLPLLQAAYEALRLYDVPGRSPLIGQPPAKREPSHARTRYGLVLNLFIVLGFLWGCLRSSAAGNRHLQNCAALLDDHPILAAACAGTATFALGGHPMGTFTAAGMVLVSARELGVARSLAAVGLAGAAGLFHLGGQPQALYFISECLVLLGIKAKKLPDLFGIAVICFATAAATGAELLRSSPNQRVDSSACLYSGLALAAVGVIRA